MRQVDDSATVPLPLGASASAGSEPDDRELVAGISRGDAHALSVLYRRHAGPVRGAALRVLADPAAAEDVVQTVFLRLWQRPEQFDEHRGLLRALLVTQARRRSIDAVRSEASRRRREQRAHDWASLSDGLADTMDVADQRARLRSAMQVLNEQQRSAVELAFFGEHSYREVAELLVAPEGTVKSRIRIALDRLRVEMLRDPGGIDWSLARDRGALVAPALPDRA